MADFGHLLPSQVEKIGTILGASGLTGFTWRDSSDFDWVTTYPELIHWPSEYRFRFLSTERRRDGTTGHSISFSPGLSTLWTEYQSVPWEEVLICIKAWTEYITREVGSGSFSEAFKRGRTLFVGGDESDSAEPFTPEEVTVAESALTEIEERIRNLEGLREEDREFVEKEFQELREELRTMKRGRWAKLALGTFFNLGARSIIPEGLLGEYWKFLMDQIRDFGGYLLPGG